VTLSRNSPDKFTEDNTLQRLVSVLLNEKNERKSDKDTKLDVLNILANVAGSSKTANVVVGQALHGVSDWFDEYISAEEGDPGQEPELHKAMVLLLARAWEYRLKTEDVLELTQGNRRIALCTVVGLLEDGETYTTELRQRQVRTHRPLQRLDSDSTRLGLDSTRAGPSPISSFLGLSVVLRFSTQARPSPRPLL
jgi:hypothetical protein